MFFHLYIWVLRGAEPWYSIQNWSKTDTQTAPECNCIIVEFFVFWVLVSNGIRNKLAGRRF